MSASGRYGRHRVCAGLVGYADLRLGERVAQVLEALEVAGGRRLRGIRNINVIDADESIYPKPRQRGLLLDGRFRAGFAQLAAHDLSLMPGSIRHSSMTSSICQGVPDTMVIVDHTGGPLRIGLYASRLEESYAAWRRAIERLARCPNVVMKLGGLGMRFLGLLRPDAGGDSSATSGRSVACVHRALHRGLLAAAMPCSRAIFPSIG